MFSIKKVYGVFFLSGGYFDFALMILLFSSDSGVVINLNLYLSGLIRTFRAMRKQVMQRLYQQD